MPRAPQCLGPVPIPKSSQEENTPRPGIELHLVAAPCDGSVLLEGHALVQDVPALGRDVVCPEIIKGLQVVAVLPPEKVDLAVVGVDAHGMPAALQGGLCPRQPCGDSASGVGLADAEVGAEEPAEEARSRSASPSAQSPWRTRVGLRAVTIGCSMCIWEQAMIEW